MSITELPTGFFNDIMVTHSQSSTLAVRRIDEHLYELEATLTLESPAALAPWAIGLSLGFEADFFWAPHLTPESGMAIDEHVFRTPALIARSEGKTVILMPSPDACAARHSCYMDLDAASKKLVVGLADTAVEGHILYRLEKTTAYDQGCHKLRFYLYTIPHALENPFRPVLEFYWGRWGNAQYEKLLPPLKNLPVYEEHTYRWAFDRWKHVVWQEFSMNGHTVGAPTFIVTTAQSPGSPLPPNEREPRSVWNQAWFCSLRAAAGLFRYATRTGNDTLAALACKTKELALAFPQQDGLFDSVVATEMQEVERDGVRYSVSCGWQTLYYGNSDRNPFAADLRDSPRHILDMCVTCEAMLDWYEHLEKDQRLLVYASAFADRLLRLQNADGFTPGWVNADGKPMGVLDDSPESAMSAVFLLHAARITGNAAWRAAGRRAIDAVLAGPAKEGRWEDFETYWSCCRWGGELVGKQIERNRMYKHCNFSMYFTALAALDAYEATRDERYLAQGQAVLDEMLMTQSSYQPPRMPIPVVGGFGVLNADSELNDARQSLFAPLLLRYAAALDNDEYRQRGMAALRVSFVMMYCPENPDVKKQWEARWPFLSEADYGFNMENYGHNGKVDENGLGIGEFTIYDWGNGLASANYEIILENDLI